MEKAQYLILSLRGEARQLISGINSENFTSYKILTDILGQRVNPKENEISKRCELRNRKRNINETAIIYG